MKDERSSKRAEMNLKKPKKTCYALDMLNRALVLYKVLKF